MSAKETPAPAGAAGAEKRRRREARAQESAKKEAPGEAMDPEETIAFLNS